jgi:putative ABC transport system substrate-binding protein
MQSDRLKRREFIKLLGGAAATWPLAARAQQRERMRRIGVLVNLTPDDAEGQARLAAFLQGLQEAGWAVGRNVRIDLRWGGGDPDSFRKQAADLIPDVVFRQWQRPLFQMLSRQSPFVRGNSSSTA